MSWIIFLPFALLFFIQMGSDPAPGLINGKEDIKSLDCSVLTRERAERLHPGFISEKSAKTSHIDENFISCQRLFFKVGDRDPRIEGMLFQLSENAETVASAVAVGRTREEGPWHVAINHPMPAVAQKIKGAVEIALAGKGFLVVQAQDPQCPSQAEKKQNDKSQHLNIVRIMQEDSRETALSAQICTKEGWQWLL